MNLSKEVKLTLVKGSQSEGTTAVKSDVVDMTNYDGCLFFTTIATADAGNYLVVEQSTTEDFASSVELEGTKAVAIENGEAVFVDVFRPLEKQGRFLRASVVRGVSTAVGVIYAAVYDGRDKPEDYAILAISPDATA